ncbi:hypothetical protein MtrunA17_Chr8g0380111 [Medicago truncatula]|uniref:Uncharacterized protein n=1 Tax=Medicago truncatula TaxID=3880 RepID=A0A396GNM0_MEDTR|nr:hypothetical protein MtrunA17_Chr8g0380111 [Medicago truncatula]
MAFSTPTSPTHVFCFKGSAKLMVPAARYQSSRATHEKFIVI